MSSDLRVQAILRMLAGTRFKTVATCAGLLAARINSACCDTVCCFTFMHAVTPPPGIQQFPQPCHALTTRRQFGRQEREALFRVSDYAQHGYQLQILNAKLWPVIGALSILFGYPLPPGTFVGSNAPCASQGSITSFISDEPAIHDLSFYFP